MPLFMLGGIEWLRSFERPPPIPGSAQGTLSIHMTSTSWYTAQSLPAGESVDGMKMETNYWESEMRPIATAVLCSHFRLNERDVFIGGFHEVRGEEGSTGVPTCDVTASFKANLTDAVYFENAMARGLDFQALYQKESIASIGWMGKLSDFTVVLSATTISNVDGQEVTKQLSTKPVTTTLAPSSAPATPAPVPAPVAPAPVPATPAPATPAPATPAPAPSTLEYTPTPAPAPATPAPAPATPAPLAEGTAATPAPAPTTEA